MGVSIRISIILVSIAILVGAVTYAVSVNTQIQRFKLDSCVQGGRYVLYKDENSTVSEYRTLWWQGRWNFEKQECEREDAKYSSIRETRQ